MNVRQFYSGHNRNDWQSGEALAEHSAMENEADVDIGAILKLLWHGKWLILICTFLAAMTGWLVASQYTPLYRASAAVLFRAQNNIGLSNVTEVFVPQQYDRVRILDEIQLLRSTSLVERVIARLALDLDPEFNPLLRPRERTLAERWLPIELLDKLPPEVENIAQDWGLLSTAPTSLTLSKAKEDGRLLVIEKVLEGLQLNAIGETRVIRIAFTSERPNKAADVANAFAQTYIVDQLDAKLEYSRAATEWLTERVTELRDQADADEEALEEARLALSESSSQSLEVTQGRLQLARTQLNQQIVRVSDLEARIERVSTGIEDGTGLIGIFGSGELAALQSLERREAELQAELDARSKVLSPSNIRLVNLRQTLEEVRENKAEEVERVVAATRQTLETARDRMSELAGEVRRLEQEVFVQFGDKADVRQLERQAAANRALYESFRMRLQETTSQVDLQQADARILSPAEPPRKPITEAEFRALLIATVLGAIIGAGIVFLRNYLNNTFRSPKQVEDLTGEKILGVLPAVGNKLKRLDVVRYIKNKPTSALVEAVRNLRTSILFYNIDAPPKVVMFTSSVPREGKSTTAMMVAQTSYQMGKSAIIVDCDLRKPTLAKLAGAEGHKHGLISLLSGKSTLDEAIFNDPETGLDMLTTVKGSKSKNINAADVLSSKIFEKLIDQLTQSYDLVILDTPPTIVVTDARVLSKLADVVVYIVQWDKTPRSAVIEGLNELRSVNAPIAGIAMTQIDEKRASKYAYDGYNYHKGKYRGYYGV